MSALAHRHVGLSIAVLAMLLVPRAADAQVRSATGGVRGTGNGPAGNAPWQPEPGPPSSSNPIESARVVWPQPVRNVDHQEPLPPSHAAIESWNPGHEEIGIPMIVDERTPHDVIQAPGRGPSKPGHGAKPSHRDRYPETHPPHPPLHHRMQPIVATVPDARSRETWKTPYSYGYFGASGKRQWSKHYGYRDRYTEWVLR